MVSFNQLPILASGSCLLAEIIYLGLLIFNSARYFFSNNWTVIISKINVSIAIIFINSIGFYLAVSNAIRDKSDSEIPIWLQFVCVIVIMLCVCLEVFFIILIIVTKGVLWLFE